MIAHSKATLEQLARLGIVPRRSVIIPHGPFTSAVDPDSLRTPGDGHGSRQLLFFGKIRPYKGGDTLLAAFAAMPRDLDVHLTVAGECTNGQLRAELAEFAEKADGRVTLQLERVPEAQLPGAAAAGRCDGLALPADHHKRKRNARSVPWTPPHGAGYSGAGRAAGRCCPPLRRNGSGTRPSALTSIAQTDAAVLAKMSAAAFAHCAATNWSEMGKRV